MILSPDLSHRPRFGRSLLLVGAVHAGAIGALFIRLTPVFEPTNEMPAIAVEMAMPAALPAPVNDVPTPRQIESPEQPPKEQPKPEKLPFDPPPQVQRSDIRPEVIVPLRTEQRPRPQQENPQPPAPATTELSAPALTPSDRTTAPITGGASPGRATAADQWDARVRARIELTKRYPTIAARQGQEDNVTVLLTLNRSGRLISASIRNSRGFTVLDEAALDAVRRAAPFPQPPAEIEGEQIRLSVIVRFHKRG